MEREGWWWVPKGANCMAMSGLGFRKVLVGNGWAVSLLPCMIELRKLFSHIVGPPILALKVLLH